MEIGLMMRKDLILALFLASGACVPVLAEDVPAVAAKLAGSGPFSDPVFQDFIETSDGYLVSANTMKVRSDFRDFRDAPAPLPAPTLKNPVPVKNVKASRPPAARAEVPAFPSSHYKVTFAGESGPLGSFVWPLGAGAKKYAREYVFLSVTPVEAVYNKLLLRLESEAGFRFVGEKVYYSKSSKRTVIMGWVPYANLAKVPKISGVAGTAVEKKSAGVPLKTKVRFTLKVPYQNRPNAFVPDFVRRLTEQNGFSSEGWFRLPGKADSKFSVFSVTGTLPVDMIGGLSRSPFVAGVEFNDPSL